jgi:dihydrofolate reductase
MAKNRIIGIDGGMPWNISEDLRFFKSVTMGHPILMGRKTYESIGGALAGRTNIVITRNRNFVADDIEVCHNIEEGLEQAKAFEELWGRDDIQPEVFVIGGAEVYNQALGCVDRIYLTEIQALPKGDAYFPDFDISDWLETDRQDRPSDSEGGPAYSFVILDRKQ